MWRRCWGGGGSCPGPWTAQSAPCAWATPCGRPSTPPSRWAHLTNSGYGRAAGSVLCAVFPVPGHKTLRQAMLTTQLLTSAQGSAADVATAAMLSIGRCQNLRRLGWKLLLQVVMHSIIPVQQYRLCEAYARFKTFMTCSTLLPQVHDEVILEGPKESADAAQAMVVDCMMRPFDGANPLDVELVVDAKHADTWFAAK